MYTNLHRSQRYRRISRSSWCRNYLRCLKTVKDFYVTWTSKFPEFKGPDLGYQHFTIIEMSSHSCKKSKLLNKKNKMYLVNLHYDFHSNVSKTWTYFTKLPCKFSPMRTSFAWSFECIFFIFLYSTIWNVRLSDVHFIYFNRPSANAQMFKLPWNKQWSEVWDGRNVCAVRVTFT